MEVGGVFGLRQGQKILPGQYYRVFHGAVDGQPPALRRDPGMVTEIEHRPFDRGRLADR